MLKMVDGTGIIGVDMVCPLGGAVSPPQPPNYDNIEMEGVGSLMLPNSLKAHLERVELIGNSVQLTTTGKNLFDSKRLQGVPGFEVEGDEITQSGYNTSTGKTLKQLCPEITPGTYILSASNGDFTGLFGLSKPMYKKSAVEVTEDDLNKIVSLVGNPNKAIKYKLQIEKGSTTTPYEPYTGLKPSPSPDNPQEIKSAGKFDEASGKYLIDMKITGKNLISDTVGFEVGSFNYNTGVNASLPDRGRLKEYIPIAPGKKYLVTVNGNTSIDDIGVHFLDINRFPVAGHGSARFISPLNAYYVRIRYKGWTENDKVSLQLQDTSLDYEPYTEQSVQIALNEPLRGVGEYKDVLTKDGIVRKIYPPYEIDLNDLRDGGYLRTNTVMFSVKVQNRTVGYASLKPSIFCNIFPDCALQTSNICNTDKECIAVGGGIILFRVNKSRLKDISSFESTKQSFIEFMADKKMIVEYALEIPITEPLPEFVQAQLSALHSENGTTHVFVDSGEVPCGIKLTYRKEK